MNPRPWSATAAVGLGAALGALVRWAFGVGLDALAPGLLFGTLAANLLGGFLIGVAVGFFDRHLDLAPPWRLFSITGFLGGLTTFSTFSAEVVGHLADGRTLAASIEIVVHVVGGLLLTLLGLGTVQWLSPSPPADEASVALERLAGE